MRTFVFWLHILWLTGMPVLVSGLLQGCQFSPGFADGLHPAPPPAMTRRALVQETPRTTRRSPFDMPEWYRMLLERPTRGAVSVRKRPGIVRGFW
ncbi:MAG TPA: hypothetical protein V6C52_04090 [Coleofasciculaceae cyanobacterium]